MSFEQMINGYLISMIYSSNNQSIIKVEEKQGNLYPFKILNYDFKTDLTTFNYSLKSFFDFIQANISDDTICVSVTTTAMENRMLIKCDIHDYNLQIDDDFTKCFYEYHITVECQ